MDRCQCRRACRVCNRSRADQNASLVAGLYLPARCVAGKHVVFGQVVDGYQVVKAAEACGSGSGSTAFDVMIKDCGQVPKGSERGVAAAGERRGSRAGFRSGPGLGQGAGLRASGRSPAHAGMRDAVLDVTGQWAKPGLCSRLIHAKPLGLGVMSRSLLGPSSSACRKTR